MHSESALNHTLPVENRISTRLQWKLYQACLIANDALMISLAFLGAYLARFQISFPIFQIEIVPSSVFYLRVSSIAMLTWLAVFFINGLYRVENLLGGTGEYALVFRSVSLGMLLVVIAGFLEPAFVLARGWLILAWGLAFSLVVLGRFVLRRLVYWMRRRGYFLSPAIVVGANDEGCLLAEQLWNWGTSGLHIVGMVDDTRAKGSAVYKHISILGDLDDLDEIVSQCGIEEIIIATSALPREQVLPIFEHYGFSERVNLRLSSGLFEIITTGLQVKEMAYVPLVCVNKVRLTGTDHFLKLALDYGLTIPGLILISPLLMLIAVAVRLDSPGPVFHRRRVMGVNGFQFEALKFRTMFTNGDEILERYPEKKAKLIQNHKIQNDPRITRVGGFLRKYSLDELPQLFNVLRHEMALVGPRMISPPEMEKYGRWGMNLLTVRPGITGLWQTSGRSDISYEERVRLDMSYIRNWTIWLDLQLLFRTIPAVIKGEGAY